MKDQNGNTLDLPLDPLMYLGRVHRGEDGRVKTLEVFYDTDTIHIEDNDEFVTFTTRILLEEDTGA
jgi:hypothetical protein